MATTPSSIQRNDAAPAQAAPDAQAPAATSAPQPQSDDASASTDANTATSDASLPSDGSKESINLHRAFSRLNESLTKLADESGVPRSLSMPHIDGQDMGDHIAAVGAALQDRGGITNNLLSVSHSKYDKSGGITVAHPAEKLRETKIPKAFAPAKSAIAAARSVLTEAEKLIGSDDRSIQIAKSQLDLIGKHGGEGMSVLDAMIALQNVVAAPLQSVARAHSGTKDGGHHAQRRPPRP
jgi:hypothetical protein